MYLALKTIALYPRPEKQGFTAMFDKNSSVQTNLPLSAAIKYQCRKIISQKTPAAGLVGKPKCLAIY